MAVTAIHNGWTGWVENGTWTGGTTQVISGASFTRETGFAIPTEHTGDVVKVVLTLANTTYQWRRTQVAADATNWATVAYRYFVSIPDFPKIRDDGFCKLYLLDGSGGSGQARGSQHSLSGFPDREMNALIYDPNTDNSSIQSGDTLNNFGWKLSSWDPADLTQVRIDIKTNTEANGFVSPLTVYLFDILRDVGTTPIKVCLSVDDSNLDNFPGDGSTHELAVKNGIYALTSNFTGTNVENTGSAEPSDIAAAKASGRWEFTNHSYKHDSYETISGSAVRSDIKRNWTYMHDTLELDQQPGFRATVRPTNGHNDTSDGEDIQSIEEELGFTYGRMGPWGAYSETLGAPNKMQLGAVTFHQTSAQGFDDHAEWKIFHDHMVTQGLCYHLYWHLLAADKGSAGTPAPTTNEVAYTELDKVFATLRDGEKAGNTDIVFFSDWAVALGVDIEYTERRPKVGTRPAAGTRPVAGTRPTVGTRVKAAA